VITTKSVLKYRLLLVLFTDLCTANSTEVSERSNKSEFGINNPLFTYTAYSVYATTLCSPKNWTTKLMVVTSPNLNRVSKFFSLLDSMVNLQ